MALALTTVVLAYTQTKDSPDGSVGSDEMTRFRWLLPDAKGSEIEDGTTASTWLHWRGVDENH
jgi:hypothetical protein